MGFWDRVTTAIAMTPWATDSSIMHERAIDSFVDEPQMQTQLELLFASRSRTTAAYWPATVQQALGVPAIFRAVSLISNTVGSLAVSAYRKGVQLPDDQRPSVIVRPNPFETPEQFYSASAWYIATQGKVWWNIASRDGDGQALAIVEIDPHEVTVTPNPNDRYRPIIVWQGREMRREDMRLIKYTPPGLGPLQYNQSAVAAAVAAQEWAANFFAVGGYPSIWVKYAGQLSGNPEDAEDQRASEIQRFKNQWTSTPPNTPKVSDDSIEDIKQFDPNPESVGMLAARSRSDIEAAQMFGIPGSLMEANASGSSLTYQNLAEVWTSFVRGCLAPNYLEKIEQALSDLLTRSTIARFNVAGLQRADALTRAQIYNLLVPLGIITAEQAAAVEGYLPGDVEFAPVPFASPQAIPAPIPLNTRSEWREARCPKCGRLATKYRGGEVEGKCHRCGTMVVAA